MCSAQGTCLVVFSALKLSFSLLPLSVLPHARSSSQQASIYRHRLISVSLVSGPTRSNKARGTRSDSTTEERNNGAQHWHSSMSQGSNRGEAVPREAPAADLGRATTRSSSARPRGDSSNSGGTGSASSSSSSSSRRGREHGRQTGAVSPTAATVTALQEQLRQQAELMRVQQLQQQVMLQQLAALTVPARSAPESGPEASGCLLYTSPSPRDGLLSRMPSSA